MREQFDVDEFSRLYDTFESAKIVHGLRSREVQSATQECVGYICGSDYTISVEGKDFNLNFGKRFEDDYHALALLHCLDEIARSGQQLYSSDLEFRPHVVEIGRDVPFASNEGMLYLNDEPWQDEDEPLNPRAIIDAMIALNGLQNGLTNNGIKMEVAYKID